MKTSLWSLGFAVACACGTARAETPAAPTAPIAPLGSGAVHLLPPLTLTFAQSVDGPLAREEAPVALGGHGTPDGSTRIAAYLAAGAGAIGVGVGAAYGIATISRKAAADKHCDRQVCDQKGLALQRVGLQDGDFATAFFAGGAALLGTGVLLILATPRALPGEARDARVVHLDVGPGGASLSGTF